MRKVTIQQCIDLGCPHQLADDFVKKINDFINRFPPDEAWQHISKTLLSNQQPFALHLHLFKTIFPNWQNDPDTAPAWIPDKKFISTTNIAHAMAKLKIHNFHEFHAWSVNHFEKFWDFVTKQLGIVFQKIPKQMCDLSDGMESPQWFPAAKMNIAESCFTADSKETAVIYQNTHGEIKKLSYGELNRLSNQVANSLLKIGHGPGDAIAIFMPMNYLAVAIYLGIIKIGGVVVSIADSFSPEEIAMRLRIAKTKRIFTQEDMIRSNKRLPLFEKLIHAYAPPSIVIRTQNTTLNLRDGDMDWDSFLIDEDQFTAYANNPMHHCNILFSSGTTAEPKAIPWNHTTPIKAASDAYFHLNIQPDDVLVWPTNLGWMMGPWLIFSALINKACIALYEDAPKDRMFGEFVQNTKATMLGVVPSLVASWRQTHCMEGLDWSSIKIFSSTGECSNPEDMLYLMSLANYKPIIEYCGGTEIGGSYITSTVIENNFPSVFTTPALGLNFILLDENQQPHNKGEVAIIPPSIGLSTELLNANHHDIYYANMPETLDKKILRRHGDQLQCIVNHYYSVLGRADDTMNLGGIKTSSAEIERAVSGIEGVLETAAIAISPSNHGPSELVIYAATQTQLDSQAVKIRMQKQINEHLNPLFKISEVVFVSELPKTASNKIMRRVLRTLYLEKKMI